MTELELNEQIARLQTSGDPDAKRRIKNLQDFYEKQEQQKAQHAAQNQQRAEAQLKERARRAFLHNPASTPEEFEAAWPQMKQKMLIDEAIKVESVIRAQQGAHTRGAF
jgi:FKBP-type peptidyl-prolyl cis-trans isomerase